MDNSEHRKYYNSSGEEVPSVTTVLKLYGKDLTGWANWLGKRGIDVKSHVSKRAEFGTYVHKIAERYFTKDDTVNQYEPNGNLTKWGYEDLLSRLAQFDMIMQRQGFQVYECEIPLEGERCGGTADIVWYNADLDKYVLLDFKTSKAVHKTMFMQLAGYAQLLKEVRGIEVSAVGIILLSKTIDDPNFSTIMKTKDNERFGFIFNKLLDIYYLLDESERRRLSSM